MGYCRYTVFWLLRQNCTVNPMTNPTAYCRYTVFWLSRQNCTLKADCYADPVPSFRFWTGRKNRHDSCKIETGFLCRDGARVIRFFARVIQQLGFGTPKIEANFNYCYVRRRVESTSLGPGLKQPSLRSDSSLAAKRRAVALHVVFL